ncbi:hypothetical protein BLNAU_21500 [Blattamonas nauphoetae]|uniref:Uncharacterized protein n=1 Tax=Blattamonas nauphoetae TaxID=2049346 RepID=A0ABQ9WWS1_9EUKA|nr:hypothetical protein BLNAU_21500 [Blattamonas nauphoetae]
MGELYGGCISIESTLEIRCLRNRNDQLAVQDTLERSRNTQSVFLIGGWGDWVVSAVRLFDRDGDDIGMGLIAMTSGTCSIDSISLGNITFSDSVKLISTSENSSNFHLAISKFVLSTITTQNPSLIEFAAKNPASTFSLSDSELPSTAQSTNKTRDYVDLLSCLLIDCCGLNNNSQNGAAVVDRGEGSDAEGRLSLSKYRKIWTQQANQQEQSLWRTGLFLETVTLGLPLNCGLVLK